MDFVLIPEGENSTPYFRLKCAQACCPWQAWLRVRPTHQSEFEPRPSPVVEWPPDPHPRFCRMFAYFPPQIKIMRSCPSLKRCDVTVGGEERSAVAQFQQEI